MEPNLENVSNEIVNASKSASTPTQPPKSKGLIAATVIFALLAVAGIAGAVYFYMDASSKASDNTKLQGQLNLIKTETGAELIETEENGTTITEVEIAESSITNAKDYIYVGDWGLKIKIPEGLEAVSYIFKTSNSGSLGVSGTDCRDGVRCQALPSFADIAGTQGQFPLGVISRHDDINFPDDVILGRKIGEIDGWSYYYTGPQASFSTAEDEIQWEMDSVNLVREMLTNMDNYSKI